MAWFGMIGFLDDRAKARFHSGDLGMSEAKKLVLQGLFAAALTALMLSPWSPLPPGQMGAFYVPFLKFPVFQSVWAYAPVVFFFVIVVGNSVNIADGMDGLAIVPSVFVLGVLGLFGYFLGNAIYAPYLNYPFLPGAGELAVFASAFAGAGIGFLWFNAYPAQIFMGDTGSLFLGGIICASAFAMDMPLILITLGVIFIIETMSDIIQVTYFKATGGKRFFKMAPLHHHLEMGGFSGKKWTERQLFTLFFTISLLFAVLSYIGVMNRF